MAATRKHGDLSAFWKDFSPAIAILTFAKPTAARLGACSAFDNPAVTLMIRGADISSMKASSVRYCVNRHVDRLRVSRDPGTIAGVIKRFKRSLDSV